MAAVLLELPHFLAHVAEYFVVLAPRLLFACMRTVSLSASAANLILLVLRLLFVQGWRQPSHAVIASCLLDGLRRASRLHSLCRGHHQHLSRSWHHPHHTVEITHEGFLGGDELTCFMIVLAHHQSTERSACQCAPFLMGLRATMVRPRPSTSAIITGLSGPPASCS